MPASASIREVRTASDEEVWRIYFAMMYLKAVVSDRANVSPDALDEHYNQMTEEEKMEQQQGYVEGL